MDPQGSVPGRFWQVLDDGRVQCDVCPRECRLRDGQRGLCFVRKNEGGRMVLTTWGRSSGFCVDPIEKKPRARRIALDSGLRYAYTGTVHDVEGGSTICHVCGQCLIGRDWYRLGDWNLEAGGCCSRCGTALPGVFEAAPGTWGARRQPVRLGGVGT